MVDIYIYIVERRLHQKHGEWRRMVCLMTFHGMIGVVDNVMFNDF